jgi:hypothetical protein
MCTKKKKKKKERRKKRKKKKEKKKEETRAGEVLHAYIASPPPYSFQKVATTSPLSQHTHFTSHEASNSKHIADCPRSLRFSPPDYLSRCRVSRPLITPCFE